MVWQRNRNKHSLTVDRRAAKAVAAMDPEAGMVVRAAKAVQVAVVRAVPAAVRAASANIFARRKFASFA